MARLCKAFLLLVVIASLLMVFLLINFSQIYVTEPKAESKDVESPHLRKLKSKYTEKNKEMKKRVMTLDEECKNLVKNGSEFQYIQKSKLDHLIVDDRYKVIYCYVPKVACTNLKRVFLLLTGKMNVSDPLMLKSGDVHASLDKYLTYLDTFPPAGIKYRFLHYKKVIFVREPFERILSAYRNKFLQTGNSYFKEKFGKKIIKRYRRNPSTDSLDKGNDVTFKEFVQYLLDRKTMEQGYNEHWETFHNLCHPCHIRYNYVGKYESLDDDVDGLLKILKVDDKIHFPARADMYKTLKTEDTLLKFYKGIKPEMLTQLWNVYAKDYNVFDYEVPPAIKKLMKPVL